MYRICIRLHRLRNILSRRTPIDSWGMKGCPLRCYRAICSCENNLSPARRRVSNGKKWRKGIRSPMTWKGPGGPQKKRFPPRHRGRNNLLVQWALSSETADAVPRRASSRPPTVISAPWRSRLRLSALESLYLIRTTSTAKRYLVQRLPSD